MQTENLVGALLYRCYDKSDFEMGIIQTCITCGNKSLILIVQNEETDEFPELEIEQTITTVWVVVVPREEVKNFLDTKTTTYNGTTYYAYVDENCETMKAVEY